MSLQAAVERQHYLKRCNANALVNSVMRTWEEGHLDHVMTKVFLRLKPVLCNIIEANCGNDLMESKRGVKHRNIKIEDVIRTMQKDDGNEVIDLLGDDLVVEDEKEANEIDLGGIVNM